MYSAIQPRRASASFPVVKTKQCDLWDTDTGLQTGQPMIGHTDAVTSVAFSPDRHRVAAASKDGTVRIWDAETGQPIGQPLVGHTQWVTSVAFSPDGSLIASGSHDKAVRLHGMPAPVHRSASR